MVSVAGQVPLGAFGQDRRTVSLAKHAATVDHVLSGRLEALAREILSNHVRERDGVETAPLEQPHDLALARRIRPGNSDPHPLSSPASAGYHAFASLGRSSS